MEISIARSRLEEMRADLDRTVSVLMGEHHLVRGGGADPGDAGANLTEADRNAASVQTALTQRAEVLAALARIEDGSYGRCVDSLTFGMALLAEQHRWPHLVDVPNADVVLIPWPDGTITRCYGAEQLRELFTGCGLEVSWIRPRTVLSPRTVSYLLARDPSSFDRLVSAELRARSDDSVGAQLIASCVKRPIS